MNHRCIIHVDMDAFYASIEQRDKPELKGKPVIVGGSVEQRGVVSAASYEARRFGLHSAMPTSEALRHCPHAIVLPVDMAKYKSASKQIHHIFEKYTDQIEPISIDEAFLDVTGSLGLFGSAENIGRQIKKEIKQATKLTASVGIAPNKFLAKLASDLEKPDGFVIITHQNMQQILDGLSVARLWGLGKVTQRKLHAHGIDTIGQFRRTSLGQLKKLLGNNAVTLLELAHGIDQRPVQPHRQAKSISSEHTFPKDVDDPQLLLNQLFQQVQEVAYRLRDKHLQASTVSIKLRYANFKSITRSQTFTQPTNSTDILWHKGRQLFHKWLKEDFAPLRLIGFEASQLSSTAQRQLLLFEQGLSAQNSPLDETIDEIRRRFGKDSIRREF